MAMEFALHDGSVMKTDGDNFVLEGNSITGPVTITKPDGTVSEGEMVKGGWQGPVTIFVPATGLRFSERYIVCCSCSLGSDRFTDIPCEGLLNGPGI